MLPWMVRAVHSIILRSSKGPLSGGEPKVRIPGGFQFPLPTLVGRSAPVS